MPHNTLLFTQNIERAKQEIVSVGGRITQQFTETVFVAHPPDSVPPDSLQESSPQQPTTLDQASQLSVDAWKNLQAETTSRAPNGTEGLSWDTSHGYLGAPNNNCAGVHESCLMEGNVLQLCKWSRRQLGWDDSVFPPLSPGTYTIKQKSSSRFVDAHEIAHKDFALMTRPVQNNGTQRWVIKGV